MRNIRNLKRLAALAVAALLLMAVAISPGAALLGVGVTFAAALIGSGNDAIRAADTSANQSKKIKSTAPRLWPPGLSMGDVNSTMVNTAATTATARRARKNHFETDMRYCGDRISMQNANNDMATARGPTALGILLPFMSKSADKIRSRTPMSNNGQVMSDATIMLKTLGAKVHASFNNALNIGLFSYRARDRGIALGLAA